MGLIKAALGSVGGVLADQWKEYFYCEALPMDVLVQQGQKRVSGRSSNTKGSENVISSGSIVSVADGQCMLIVDNGKIVEVCAEPGEFTYDASSEPSLLAGGLNLANIKAVFATVGKRFTFGGEPPKDQRVYYVNTKELMGNKYGTPQMIPFKIVDESINLKMTVSIKCFGEYSYRISNPLLFYANVCSNISGQFKRDTIEGQLKTELLTALQPAFAQISAQGIEYTELPGHTMEIVDALNEVLSKKWRDLRGIEIVSFGVSSVAADPEDEARLKELQRNAVFRDPSMAAAQMVGAQSSAMQSAANNPNGAAMGFFGMGMAQQAGGMNAANLFQVAQQQQMAQQQMAAQQAAQQQAQAAPAPAAPAADSWTCSCGAVATGKFCPECGAKKPEPKTIQVDGWTCSCGAVNQGKFCAECGAKKPAGVPQYKCDKCGWVPADPANPPKFCPECGDPFGDEDIQ